MNAFHVSFDVLLQFGLIWASNANTSEFLIIATNEPYMSVEAISLHVDLTADFTLVLVVSRFIIGIP